MLFQFVKDIASGKSRAFYTAFKGFQNRLLDGVDKMPCPSNAVQFAFLRILANHIEATGIFCEALFYGLRDDPPIFSVDQLSALSEEDGNLLYSAFLIGLIRYSNVENQEVGDWLTTAAVNIMPNVVAPKAEGLSLNMRGYDADGCDRQIIAILKQMFPDTLSDPVRRLAISTCMASIAVGLNGETKKLFADSVTNEQ